MISSLKTGVFNNYELISIIDKIYEKGSLLKETECSGETYHH